MLRKELMFFALLLIAGLACADLGVSTYTVTPTTLSPGLTGSVTITFSNTGTSTISGIRLQPSGQGFVFSSSSIDAGDIAAGGSTIVTVPFRIKSDIDAGVYVLQVNAYWTAAVGTTYKQLSIPITVENPAQFQALDTELDRTVVSPGGSFNIWTTIRNQGGKATNAVLKTNSSNLLLGGSSQINLGTIDKNGEIFINQTIVTATATPSGLYKIPFMLTYVDELGETQTTVISVGEINVVRGVAEFLITTSTDKEGIAPGDRIKLSVTIKNIGNDDIYSAKVSIGDSNYFTTIGTSEKFVSLLMVGDEEMVIYDLGVSGNTPAGYYSVNLTIDYSDHLGEKQTSVKKSIGLDIVGSPEIAVITSTSPAPVTGGKSYTVSMQISNIGTTEIRALRVMVESDDIQFINAHEEYVGTLTLDDYTTVQYNTYVPQLEPGNYPVTVNLIYRDAHNTQHEENKTTYVKIISAEDAAKISGNGHGLGLLETIVILVVASIILFAAYKGVYKKQKLI